MNCILILHGPKKNHHSVRFLPFLGPFRSKTCFQVIYLTQSSYDCSEKLRYNENNPHRLDIADENLLGQLMKIYVTKSESLR